MKKKLMNGTWNLIGIALQDTEKDGDETEQKIFSAIDDEESMGYGIGKVIEHENTLTEIELSEEELEKIEYSIMDAGTLDTDVKINCLKELWNVKR